MLSQNSVFTIEKFQVLYKQGYDNYKTLANQTFIFVKIRKLGYYVTAVVTCGNSQSKTHQIAHARQFEPQKRQYATTELGCRRLFLNLNIDITRCKFTIHIFIFPTHKKIHCLYGPLWSAGGTRGIFLVCRELKITTDGMNIGPYTTASLSFTWNKFSNTDRYLKDKLLIKGFFFFFLPNKLLTFMFVLQ